MTTPGEHFEPTPEQPQVPPKAETAETKNMLESEVFGPCETKGECVGLSAAQRKQLGVEVNDKVAVRGPNGKRIGLFTVVKGSKAAMEAGKITANVPEGTGKIRVEKIGEVPGVTFVLAGRHLNDGAIVGLTQKQRKVLGVQEGEKVRLKQGTRDLGEFTVGKGRAEHVNDSNKITANVPDDVQGEITVEKMA